VDRLSTDLGSTDLTDYGARLRRRWWVVALGVLLGLGAGLAITAAQSKTYTSTTSVLVAQTAASTGSVDGGRTSSSVNLDTESQIVQSAQVADAARTLLRTDTPVTELQQQVSVNVPPNSSVLAVSFDGGTPKAAQEGSHAFAQAYLTDRADQAKKQVDVSVANLQAQLKTAQDQLQAASDKSAALVDNSPEKILADAQRTIIVNQVNDLLGRLAPLQSNTIDPGQIITDAPLPQSASSPIPALNLGAGLVAGLLLGLALAVLSDRTDHRLRRSGDVARQVGLPVLATVPADRSGTAFPGDEQGALFDRLRNTLAGAGTTVRALQVADPGAHGASGVVAAQLARSLVRAHGRATLVIAHPGSTLPEATGTTGHPGLVEVLRGEASLADVGTRVPQLPGVTVVPPGRDPGELEGLLQSPSARTVLESLVAGGPGLVLETGGTGDSAAAQAVAADADVLLLVAERGRTDARAVVAAADGARSMGRPVAGVVLVTAVTRRPAAPASSVARSEAGVTLDKPRGSVRAEPAATSGWRPGGSGADQPLPR